MCKTWMPDFERFLPFIHAFIRQVFIEPVFLQGILLALGPRISGLIKCSILGWRQMCEMCRIVTVKQRCSDRRYWEGGAGVFASGGSLKPGYREQECRPSNSHLKDSKAEKDPDVIQEHIIVISKKKSDICPASVRRSHWKEKFHWSFMSVSL